MKRFWPALPILLALLFPGCGSRGGASPAPANPVVGPSAAANDANWPSFRGTLASGVADGQNLPDSWNAESGENILWKTRIPGLAHSSPVIWGDRIFVTSAISSRPDASFRHGLYGDGAASDDRTLHRWSVYSLDKKSGEILWERTAAEGVPRDKRHIKASYANSTAATDGRYVVALFGSEGLHAFDMDGNVAWKRDLGRLDLGAYNAKEYEWGSASSPIIYRDMVIVQCDTQGESFLLAVDVTSGEIVWKVTRDELPSWGTPTVYEGPERAELITNASNFIRAYDPMTGQELWRLGGSSKITAPTPIVAEGLIFVASGRRPEKPIFAIRPGASGDITLDPDQTASEWIAWSKTNRGSYMPTPIAYGGYLYVLANQGILDAYDLETGEEIYRERVPHAGGGFSGSPVAADGRIYLPGEDGDIFVIEAGPRFNLLATNSVGELLMATPAISDGVLYVRGEHHLFAIGS